MPWGRGAGGGERGVEVMLALKLYQDTPELTQTGLYLMQITLFLLPKRVQSAGSLHFTGGYMRLAPRNFSGLWG